MPRGVAKDRQGEDEAKAGQALDDKDSGRVIDSEATRHDKDKV
jgi:hypothetical protein